MDRILNDKFQVFEFDDKENGVEPYNHKFRGELGIRRTKKKRDDDSPIAKYHFLQSFTGGHTEIKDRGRSEPLDVEAEVAQETKETQNENSTEFLDVDADDRSLDSKFTAMFSNFTPTEDDPVKAEMSRTASTQTIQPLSKESSKIRSTIASFLATSALCTPKKQVLLENQSCEPDFGGCEIDDENKIVKIFPGFILYGDTSWGKSCVTFSCNGIKLDGSTLNGTNNTLCCEWTNRDVMKIESNWKASVETAMVCIHLRSKNSKGSANANKVSALEQLTFGVYDPDWFKGEEAIKNLDRRYKDKWNIEIDMLSNENELCSGSSILSLKKYSYREILLSDLVYHDISSDKPFQDVIYPKGDPDAVIIRQKDMELLEPERFINDTIIDFYNKYLARKYQLEEKHRFHFFNSFFFRKLADLDKDRSKAYKGKAAYQRVRKWTRNIEIFRKDYIFIPVNYSFHWSLLVICHPGEVANLKGEECEIVSKVPCILHMDSIRGSHKGLKNLIQSYLCEEWKERHNDSIEDASSKFKQIRFFSLKLPQQENLFDCGLFLLHYVERFLIEAPLNFCPLNASKSSNFLSKNWFLPKEASLKRNIIRKLIYDIYEDQSRNVPKADSIDQNHSTAPSATCDQDIKVIVLERVNSPTKAHVISSSSNGEEVRGSLSELRDDLSIRKPGLVSCGISELGACSNSYTDGNYLRSPIPGHATLLIQEVEEIVPESPLDIVDSEGEAEFKTKHEVYSFLDSPLHTDEKVSESPLLVEDSEEGQHQKCFSVPKSSSGSPTFYAIDVDVDVDVDDIQWPQEREQFEKDKAACGVSNLDKELADCFVKDSDDEDSNNEGNKSRCFRFSKRRLRKQLSKSGVPGHSS